MASNRVIAMQCIDKNGKAIASSGGCAIITLAGSQLRLGLFDQNQNALAQPAALSRGYLYAQVAKANVPVDIYLQAPTGHFQVMKNVMPGDRSVVIFDIDDLNTTYVVPYHITDFPANTEKDTGIDFPVGSQVMAEGLASEVITADATRTINVGTLSTESGGSASAIALALPIAAVGVNKATAAATSTYGAGVQTNIATTPVVPVPESKVIVAANPSLSMTISSGATTATGYIIIPVQLSRTSVFPQ